QVNVSIVTYVRSGVHVVRLLGGSCRGGSSRFRWGTRRTALPAPLVLRQLVGQPNPGLAQLTQNRPSLGRREASLVTRGPQLRKRQVPLAPPALDEVIHSGRARLVIRADHPLGR